MIEAYPLQWPVGYKRTPPGNRKKSSFKQSMDRAQRFLRDEISRLGGLELVVSTDIPVRNDGMLYADWMKRNIDDPGVAVYFKYKGKDVSMCCDQYSKIWENVYALGKGIEALRGMERWGVSEFLDRAFTGFKAIPEQTSYNLKNIWDILELPVKPASADPVHAAFKKLAKVRHPDIPETGSSAAFAELQYAYKQALMFFNNQ